MNAVNFSNTKQVKPFINENYKHSDSAYQERSSLVRNQLRMFEIIESTPNGKAIHHVVVQRHTLKLLSTTNRALKMMEAHGFKETPPASKINELDLDYVRKNGIVEKDVFVAWYVATGTGMSIPEPTAFSVMSVEDSKCDEVGFVASTPFNDCFEKYLRTEHMHRNVANAPRIPNYINPRFRFVVEEIEVDGTNGKGVLDYIFLTFTEAAVLMGSVFDKKRSVFPVYSRGPRTATANPTINPFMQNVRGDDPTKHISKPAKPVGVTYGRMWSDVMKAPTIIQGLHADRVVLATIPFNAEHIFVEMQLHD